MLITLSPGPHTTAQSTPPASNRVKPQGFSWAGPRNGPLYVKRVIGLEGKKGGRRWGEGQGTPGYDASL